MRHGDSAAADRPKASHSTDIRVWGECLVDLFSGNTEQASTKCNRQHFGRCTWNHDCKVRNTDSIHLASVPCGSNNSISLCSLSISRAISWPRYVPFLFARSHALATSVGSRILVPASSEGERSPPEQDEDNGTLLLRQPTLPLVTITPTWGAFRSCGREVCANVKLPAIASL